MESPTKTGIIYDPLMLLHTCDGYHTEKAIRASSIIKHLKDKHYLEHPKIDFVDKIEEAPFEVIELVHSKEYIERVGKLLDEQQEQIMIGDTYYNKHSRSASHLAVGGVVKGIDNVLSGKWRNAFAVVRPPGHHSGGHNSIRGFCVYNNVAIGAMHARNKHKVQRIAIFDWDIHHGDGTQHVFRQDPNVLFMSLHRHDHGSFYPGKSGSHLNVGQGAAEGRQVNIPWNTYGDKDEEYYKVVPGDNEYIFVFERVLYPVLKEFKPQLILVSAGFDSARGDPLGNIGLGPDGYSYMTRKLQKLAPLLAVLEGGYNLKSISWASEAVVSALLDEEGPRETALTDDEVKWKCWLPDYYHENIKMVLETVKTHWPILSSKKLEDYEKAIKENVKREFGNIKYDDDEVYPYRSESNK